MTSIYKYEHPYVCTDAVVFRINTEATDNYRKLPEASLSVLLYQRESEPFKGLWSLPGGFLNIDETPEDNIRRKLASKSPVTECYLEQLYTFCDIDRDPRGRVISVAYLGLMADNKSEGEWFTVKIEGEDIILSNGSTRLTEASISFDHYYIIKTALDRLRAKLSYTDIIFNLLPEEFTLRQLQNVYEVVQGKEELTANFRRKIAHMVKETNRYTTDKGHRPAQIYVKA